jgi:putative membrane protein
MRRLVLLLAAIGGVASASGLPKEDRHFVDAAARANRAEIMMGKLALDRAQDEAVRDTAKRLVDDHERLGATLNGISVRHQFDLPEGVTDADQRIYARLAKLQGAEFDRAYVNVELRAHREAIGLFSAERHYGQVDALVRFAKHSLPVLREHQRMLEALRLEETS